MHMRLMVDRVSYRRILRNGKAARVCALNDFVSTTRKDPARLEHAYESRRNLLLAAFRAKGGAVAVKMTDDVHYGRPVLARVTDVGPLFGDGLRFYVDVTVNERRKGVAK